MTIKVVRSPPSVMKVPPSFVAVRLSGAFPNAAAKLIFDAWLNLVAPVSVGGEAEVAASSFLSPEHLSTAATVRKTAPAAASNPPAIAQVRP